MSSRPGSLIDELVCLLDEAFQRKSWHGTNLRGSIRRMSAEEAGRRSGPGRHRIVDIVVHCAYWKYAVRRRLRGEKRGSFPLTGSNWFDLPEPLDAAAWRAYVRVLESQHQALRAAVAALLPADLAKAPAASKASNAMLIRGVAMHDVYHAGQIQIIKALYKGR